MTATNPHHGGVGKTSAVHFVVAQGRSLFGGWRPKGPIRHSLPYMVDWAKGVDSHDDQCSQNRFHMVKSRTNGIGKQ